MSGIAAMFFGGGSPSFAGSWDLDLGGFLGSTDYGQGVALGYDGANIPYALIGGRSTIFGSDGKGFAYRVNTARETVWTGSTTTSGGVGSYAIAADTAYNTLTTLTGSNGFLVKIDTSGAVSWQRKLSHASTVNLYGVAADGSDNIYVCGYLNTQKVAFVAKYNSSGTIQWQRTLTTTNNIILTAIASDSSGNTVAGGQYYDGSDYKPFVVKYNSSGSIQWQQTIAYSYADTAYEVKGITLDGSGNAYLNIQYEDAGSLTLYFVKLNSSGAFQWGRFAADTPVTGGFGSATIDDAGYIYFASTVNYSGSNAANVTKVDSSAAVQFIRRIRADTSLSGTSIAIDTQEFMWVTGYIGSNVFLTRLPRSGGTTGSYTLPTSPTTSLTIESETASLTSRTFTATTTTLTDAAGNLTDAAGGLTTGTFATTAYTTAV